MNLIMNACDAIKDANQKNGKITIGCKVANNMALITIQDNGCGMSDETKSKLFEPFYTTKEVGHGTGLGLSITFGIVQKHEGSLTVESKPNQGSTFKLLLPLS